MARLGQRVEAGEALAQAGEPEMQAGNFILTNGTVAGTNGNDTMLAAGVFRIIYRGTATIVEGGDLMTAVATVMQSSIDIAPPGALPEVGERDVWLYQTTDDGNVLPQEGDLYRTDGLETAVYLSLYGGNPEDNGSTGNRQAWWGNQGLEDPAQAMTSRFQNLVEGIALSSGNLLRIEDAAAQDLAWLEDLGFTVRVSSRLTKLNRLELTVNIDGDQFNFTN
ncbi:hypothetical protein [Vibrio phage CKB-S1]|nr:hypothetical protein [Vibrio phage CKB-S1]